MSKIRVDQLEDLAATATINIADIALKNELIASVIDVTPSGNLTSTDVQAALVELQLDVDTKQAGDATLTALAGVVSAANTITYATAADTFTTTPLTAFARTLLDDADAATMRSTLGVSQVIQNQLVSAWVSFNGTGSPAIIGSYNVASITDNGVGDYTINFTSSLLNANYAVNGTTLSLDADTLQIVSVRATSGTGSATTKTTSAVRVVVGGIAAAALADAGEVYIAILGGLV